MDENTFLNDIETIRNISRKIYEPANNNDELVRYINMLPDEVKQRNFENFKDKKGVIIDIRREVSSIIKDRYISKEELDKIITTAKNQDPTKFNIYKDWYNILHPLILEEFYVQIKKAIKGIIEFTLNELDCHGEIIAKDFGFTGVRQEGNDRCWIAFINNTHKSQKRAKQLFLQIRNGEIEYCFNFWFANEKKDVHIVPDNQPFNVDDYLSVFKKHLPEVSSYKAITEEDIQNAYKLIKFDSLEDEPMQTINPDHPLNQILYGPPGTGKTYHTINKALEILGEATDGKERNELKATFKKYVDNGQVSFVTFHQSMSYEDFVEGIKPGTNEAQQVIYDIEPGIFKQIVSNAKDNWSDYHKGRNDEISFDEAFSMLQEEWEDKPEIKIPMSTAGKDFTISRFSQTSIHFKKSNGGTSHTLSIATLGNYFYQETKEVSKRGLGNYYNALIKQLKTYKATQVITKQIKPYILIIDEINRGNVSQIFGELITLIEEDKRLGQPEELEVTLPYSKEEKFGVPPNLYIIGTMNTADRSVEALDTALRRRFCFEEMPPMHRLLELQNPIQLNNGETITPSELLETINSRIEALLDKDHLIGHSYFINVKETRQLQEVFHRNIIPLLQEYFFGDYGKIGLVLGSGFVQTVQRPDNSTSLFADFAYDETDPSEYAARPIYKTVDVKKMTIQQFEEAIIKLCKKQ